MSPEYEQNLSPEVTAAVRRIEDYISQSTGQAPTPEEMANAMTRYFVLKEILAFIKMSRGEDQAQ